MKTRYLPIYVRCVVFSLGVIVLILVSVIETT